MVTLRCPDWHRICSFVGPCGMEKHGFLRRLRQCGVGRTRLDARDGRSGGNAIEALDRSYAAR